MTPSPAAPPAPLTASAFHKPAPVETILATLATVTSHAGDPVAITIDARARLIQVTADPRIYDCWHSHLQIVSPEVRDDPPWFQAANERVNVSVHGWTLHLRRWM